MTINTHDLSLEEKRALVRKKYEAKKQKSSNKFDYDSLPEYAKLTYDMALSSESVEHMESKMFSSWMDAISEDNAYSFEVPRLAGQTPEVSVECHNGLTLDLLNFGSYNYLGYSMQPEVISAAKDALDRFGLGAASSPILSGTFSLHCELEKALLDFYDLPGRGVSLFSSGYGVNLGAISAFVNQGHQVILDRACHVSILEGAQLSKANIQYFRHNDVANLEEMLQRVEPSKNRVLVCTEGVYSADGDYGALREISNLCKKYNAALMVDEAHSILVSGDKGRGACEVAGVLEDVDLICLTFSKGFGGIGGAVIASQEMNRYINWYAKCRMFSCALDPAVTGGLLKVLELVQSEDGQQRRQRLHKNAALLRELLMPYVDIGDSETWIVPVFYRRGELTFVLNNYLQKRGLDTSIMQFPAVPLGEARIRLFVTSEQTEEHIRRCARIIREAADHFGFLKGAS